MEGETNMEDLLINGQQGKEIAYFIYKNLNEYIKEMEKEFLNFLKEKEEGGKKENEKN